MMPTLGTRLAVLAAVTSIALITGCGQEDAPVTGAGGSTPEATTSAEPSTPVDNPAPQSVIEKSISLLAAQLGVDPTQIEVIRAIEVEWRDGSVGCAKEGTAYTDAIVPGSLVELTVVGTTYAFHQGSTQPPFYCENPTEPLDAQ